ncbi:MAG TPA: carboxylating nicotinate-nucleotide diphosphorylase [Phycisphaerales bacterium]|nr:carboxylating nicotinate-nucleotide diphosphorylase [Phycisphaerales bacterium]
MTSPSDLNSLGLLALFAELERTGLPRRLLELARDEDLGAGAAQGDLTTESWFTDQRHAEAKLAAREPGVASGIAALPLILDVFGCTAVVKVRVADGARFSRGEVLATISGSLPNLLRIERTMLNLVSRLSGIATLTSEYVGAIGAGTRAALYDTRKTTPGLRVLEKYAVRCGGGRSHRLGLHDAVLIKDNHLAGVPKAQQVERLVDASRRAREARPGCFVQIEVDSLEQLERFLATPAGTIDAVLLDNMTPDELKRAVAVRDRIRPGVQLEASGGITLETIRAVALSGMDRISVGAITHGARAIDLGLDIEATAP